MTGYRRNFMAGGSFFFTVNLAERRQRLLTQHIDKLRTAFRETRRHHPFTIDAVAVLPDHLHTIWTLPEADANFATRWRLIKSAFSRRLTAGLDGGLVICNLAEVLCSRARIAEWSRLRPTFFACH